VAAIVPILILGGVLFFLRSLAPSAPSPIEPTRLYPGEKVVDTAFGGLGNHSNRTARGRVIRSLYLTDLRLMWNSAGRSPIGEGDIAFGELRLVKAEMGMRYPNS
jgi:hypothetical protein